MHKREFKIFADFDGTITLKDIGEEIFRKFGSTEKVNEIIKNLLTDKISSRQCWKQLCETVPSIDENQLGEFIDQLDIDPTFIPFFNFCKDREIELVVLSDGFDFYIDRIFAKAGLSDVKYYSNKLFVNEKGKLKTEYPHYDASFPRSANCKRNHILNHSSDDDYTIYIGDGNSDKDAAQYCDFIFAKRDLLKFCSKEKISFYPFNNFEDVTVKLKELLAKKNLKKRHQAELKRKSAYIAE